VVIILLVIAVFSRRRQQMGLIWGFMGWQRCQRSFPSKSPSQWGHPPPRAAALLSRVHPLSCTPARSRLASGSSSSTKGDTGNSQTAARFLCGDHISTADNKNQPFPPSLRPCWLPPCPGSLPGCGRRSLMSLRWRCRHGKSPEPRGVPHPAPFCPKTAWPGLGKVVAWGQHSGAWRSDAVAPAPDFQGDCT